MTADREPQTEAGRALLRLRWDGHVAGSMREHILAIEAEAAASIGARLRELEGLLLELRYEFNELGWMDVVRDIDAALGEGSR